jgi:prophage regulatory protein
MDIIASTQCILRPSQAAEFLSISRSTLWRFAKDSSFPKKIQMGVKSVGWRQHDLLQWIESRKAA